MSQIKPKISTLIIQVEIFFLVLDKKVQLNPLQKTPKFLIFKKYFFLILIES